MGRVPSYQSRVYLDEHHFSGRTSEFEMVVDNNLVPVTAINEAAEEYVEALYGGTVRQNSFFDGASGEIDAETFSHINDNAQHLLGLYPGNDASHGDIGYEMEVQPDGQVRPVVVTGAVLLNINWQVEGPIVRSTVLCNGAVTATGAVTNSNKNTGATTAGTVFVGILRVLSVTGAGSITVEIEQSTDDGVGDAYEQVIAFTAKTAVGSQRKSVATATEAYKRVNVTAYATFTSVTIMVVVGYEQGTVPPV